MEQLRNKTVTIRKEHYCYGCSRKMPVGTKMQYIVGVDNGDLRSSYWCDICQEYWGEYQRYDDECEFGGLKSNDPEGWEEIREESEAKE